MKVYELRAVVSLAEECDFQGHLDLTGRGHRRGQINRLLLFVAGSLASVWFGACPQQRQQSNWTL